IKLILGKRELLTGHLLILDALKMQFKELTFDQNPHCPSCFPPKREHDDLRGAKRRSGHPLGHPINKTDDLRTQRSGHPLGHPINQTEEMDHEISPRQLKQKLDNKEKIFLLDVREPFEKQIADIGVVLIP